MIYTLVLFLIVIVQGLSGLDECQHDCCPVAVRASECSTHLDFLIIIESTDSIGDNDWVVAQQFVEDILSAVSLDDRQVAFLTFATDAVVAFDFDSPANDDTDALLAAVAAVPHQAGPVSDVRFTAGLDKGLEVILTRDGTRTNIPLVCIFLTSVSNSPGDGPNLVSSAKALHPHCTGGFVVIGVTTLINMTELQLILSGPNHVYAIDEYNHMATHIQMVVLETCEFCCVILPDITLERYKYSTNDISVYKGARNLIQATHGMCEEIHGMEKEFLHKLREINSDFSGALYSRLLNAMTELTRQLSVLSDKFLPQVRISKRAKDYLIDRWLPDKFGKQLNKVEKNFKKVVKEALKEIKESTASEKNRVRKYIRKDFNNNSQALFDALQELTVSLLIKLQKD